MSFTQDVRPNTGHEFTLVRDYDASRELVFRMWTDPVHLRTWSCPHGFTIPEAEAEGSEARPGESFRVVFQGPGSVRFRLRGAYLEVNPVSRLVFTHAWEQDDGSTTPATTVDVRLDDLGGRTRLTLHQAFFDSVPVRDGHEAGWSEALDKLAAHMAAQA
jgi:uncharacterized protein YndB with AHSA1/START domain